MDSITLRGIFEEDFAERQEEARRRAGDGEVPKLPQSVVEGMCKDFVDAWMALDELSIDDDFVQKQVLRLASMEKVCGADGGDCGCAANLDKPHPCLTRLVQQHVRAAIADVQHAVQLYSRLQCNPSACAHFREQLRALERISIWLTGHRNSRAREEGVRLLHAIYDGHDWQVSRCGMLCSAAPVLPARRGAGS